MQIERAMQGIRTLGPGERFVLWVNGCFRRCKGCVSQRLQAFNPFNEQDVIEYLSRFDFSGVTGVTLSGGEPFEQYTELCRAVKYFNEQGIEDILIYTGYTIEELRAKKISEIDYVLEHIAVLIDGPYIQKMDSGRGNLKGSDNQRVIVLNPKFRLLYDEYYCDERAMQEIYIGNIILAAGIPDREYISKFKNTKGDI
ncbi:MAG: 4Fe-4S single cluster domain-containing protein [Candidatus Coproplasma sp.]